jgi:hypothetical protein
MEENKDELKDIKADEKYPYIKRMLSALDRFLQKRVAAIGAAYFLALLIGGIVLFSNGISVYASSGTYENAKPAVSSAMVYSIIGVLTFLFSVICARVIAVRISKTKIAKNVVVNPEI